MTTMTSEPTAEWREELAGLSFEAAYGRLEETVGRLERGELPLAEAELLYRQGMELAERCQQMLSETELRITEVGDGRNGGPASPFGGGAAAGGVGGAGRGDDDVDGWEFPPFDPDDPALIGDDDDDDVPF